MRYRNLLLLPLCFVLSTPNMAAAFGGGGAAAIKSSWINGLHNMVGQLTSLGTYLTGVRGAFYDAQQQIQTQRLLQQLQAEAARDYTPSDSLCRFGTLARSLAGSESDGYLERKTLTGLLMKRETGNIFANAISSPTGIGKRIKFANTNCDPADMEGKVGKGFCTPEVLADRINKDIEFARLWDSRLSMDINFRNATISRDEEDLLSFLTLSFNPRPFSDIAPEKLSGLGAETFVERMRSIYAARSVVYDSISALVARRSATESGAASYMAAAIQEMTGGNINDARRTLEAENPPTSGDGSTPGSRPVSYTAQMEVLTKKLYQNPNFYANLIDKPANVARMNASMEAIYLMQRRDMLETLLRREMMLAVMVEMEIRKAQNYAEARATRAVGRR